MKIKTKYNIGDIVEYNDIYIMTIFYGRIKSLDIKISSFNGLAISYEVEDLINYKINNEDTIKTTLVGEWHIEKKLNKKQFEKTFTKLLAQKTVEKQIQLEKVVEK